MGRYWAETDAGRARLNGAAAAFSRRQLCGSPLVRQGNNVRAPRLCAPPVAACDASRELVPALATLRASGEGRTTYTDSQGAKDHVKTEGPIK